MRHDNYFTEIARLSAMLTMHGIAHTITELDDGYQIRPVFGEWDVVSRAMTGKLLEGYKGPFVKDEKYFNGIEWVDFDDVIPHLTAEEALAYIVG